MSRLLPVRVATIAAILSALQSLFISRLFAIFTASEQKKRLFMYRCIQVKNIMRVESQMSDGKISREILNSN
jgi:hypothetical protein